MNRAAAAALAPPPLRVACWSGVATADVDANRRSIRDAATRAADAGARILLTPECALVGYPGGGRGDLAGIDWCRVADAEDELILAAERCGLVLGLGSASPMRSDASAIGNDLLVGGAGCAPVRYRKRSLTPSDEAHFAAGAAPAWCAVDGWRLGLAICFDLRFSRCWTDLAAGGADAVLCIAHMAGDDADPGTKSAVIPCLCAARAAEFAMPLAFANTGAADRWLDSGFWDARGMRIAVGGGLPAAELVHRAALHPWYGMLRDRALSPPSGDASLARGPAAPA